MTSQDRLKGAAAAVAVQGLLGWLLLSGLAATWRHVPEPAITVFEIAPPPPPPPLERKAPQPKPRPRPPGEPSPPALRSAATELVVPPPVIPPPLPPPIVTTLKPFTGTQASTGAAPVAGPGTGAGGVGDGYGGGGDGTGGGAPPRQVAGRLKDSDYPQSAALAGTSGIVGVRYLVGVDGRVGECRVVRPSGSADLDDTTCRLIQQRFRFRPSRDERGHKVPAWLIETHEWVIEKPAPAPSP